MKGAAQAEVMIFKSGLKNNNSRGPEGVFVKPCGKKNKTFGASLHVLHLNVINNTRFKEQTTTNEMTEAHYCHSENHSQEFHQQIVPPPPQDNSSICTREGWGKVEVVRLRRLSWQPCPQKAMPSR